MVVKLYSFDIFDTLVTRRVARPVGIFALMQKIISETTLPEFVKNNFFRLRIESEKIVRKCIKRKFNVDEISIDDIYNFIKDNYYLTVEQVEYLKNLEISTEISNLVPIDENVSKMCKLIGEGHRVVLISDMYLSSEILSKILTQVDKRFNNIKIYASSDFKARKSDGSLYYEVQRLEKVDFSEWCHTGDNKNADIIQSRLLGITAVYYKNKPLLEYEKFLLDKVNDNVCFQFTVGSARLSRYKRQEKNQNKYNFGASFAAPVLYNYVNYVIEQSLARNFKTLHFISRDGYILKLIADRIISKKGLSLKTKYIYGSRLAWKLPTENNFDEFIERIFEEYKKFFTIKMIAKPLGIESSELAKIVGIADIERKLTIEQQAVLLAKLKTPEVRKGLIELNRSKKNLLVEYLKQDVDLADENIAFVDLDGSGKTQDILSEFLNEIKPCKVYFFYITNTLMEQNYQSIKLCYGLYRPFFHWIELLGRTTYGQTLGYKYENDKVVPVLDDGIDGIMTNWGYKEYLDGVCSFVDNIIDSELVNDVCFASLDIYSVYYDYIKNNLDKKTADILGSIPCSHVGLEKNIKQSSPAYNLGCLILEYLTPWVYKEKQNSYLPFVSLARSSNLCRAFFRFTKKNPSLLKLIFNFNVDKFKNKVILNILGIKISSTTLYNKLLKK